MTDRERPPLRIFIVNDSATVRAALARALVAEDPTIQVVAQAADGRDAVAGVRDHHPDVVLMDIVMPGMDGYAATRAVMTEHPTPIVLYSSIVSPRDVAVAMEALRCGALSVAEALPAPSEPTYLARRAALAQLLRSMANVNVGPRRHEHRAPSVAPRRSGRVAAIGIASSTGGPQALDEILRRLPKGSMLPILVVQHIARGFTVGFAQWLSDVTGHPVCVAVDGATAVRGTVYIAPEDRQLGIDSMLRLSVSLDRPVGVFRPSGTHLFHSLCRALGSRAAGVVLTGMGNDGAEGLAALHAAGGPTAVQDEATSVIFGMPRAAIEAGADPEVLPLELIAAWIVDRSSE